MCFFHVFFPNNPLHTVQQKQNACAFTIDLIRRRIGTGGLPPLHTMPVS